MQYLRCKCGKNEMWTTDGSPPCLFCEECGTTLAGGPSGHKEPIPHQLFREVREIKGHPTVQLRCRRCWEKFPNDPNAQVVEPDSELVQLVLAKN